jgi:hypothetical protein
MSVQLLIQDLVVACAFAATIYLYNATLVRKLGEKMDTMKVRRISRRFQFGAIALTVFLMLAGLAYQSGMVQGLAAYALVGTAGVAMVICLQVFKRLMR